MGAVLDLCCGPQKYAGAIGIDIYPFDGVDVVQDVRAGLPFEDSTFDMVLAKHCLEHFTGFDLMRLVNEMWRVTKPGGQWIVVVPDATSPNRYKDPTHVERDWHEDSFDMWAVDANGDWPIFVGPMYGRQAKLHVKATQVTQNKQRDRYYEIEVIKP